VSTTVLTEADNEKALSVASGETLVINLPENPTTGYRWQLDSLDSRLIDVAGDSYIPSQGAKIGGGGTRTFTLHALSSGTVRISLKLKREWEPADTYASHFAIIVDVQS